MKAKAFNRQVNQMKKVADFTFSKVFSSMQLLNFTVLYYNFDFDKEDIKTFNSHMIDYNNECLDDDKEFFSEEERIFTQYGFSCHKAAIEFPIRAKIRMMGKMPKSKIEWEIAFRNATDAIEVCLVLILHEFTKNWNVTPSDVAEYWDNLKANSMNYANGMTDEFVKQYFRDEIDLDIKG